jgi:hypothetical protein
MTTQTTTVRGTHTRNIPKIFGVLFVCLSLLASALTVLLPHGSSAASSTLVLSPDADTYVRQSTPTSGYPTSSQIAVVGGSDVRQAFLRFTVSGLPAGAGIQSAKLRLIVTNDSTSGGIVSAISNTSWPENIIWNTRPAIDGVQLGQFGAVAINQIVEANLTTAIKGNGVYSFAISSPPTNSNTAGYGTRENSTVALRPQLILTLADGTATQPTATVATTPQPTTTAATTPQPTATPTTVTQPAPSQSGCVRPYASTSPWNTPIGSSPIYDAQSSYHITALAGTFGSDPTQYTMPVYEVSSSTPLRSVKLSGVFSTVVDNGTRLTNQSGATVQVPIPAGASSAAGNDAQIVILNRQTGDEWGFSKAVANADGTWSASNGYRYNTAWSAVPPSHFASRGAGVPYLTGLIRPCEIARGYIDHAIAFAYDYPTAQYVYPATRSDGNGSGPDLPEGARLQLDPQLTDAQIQGWGCTGSCLIIAHALQTYGMITIDKSGHPKIYAEYEGTAHWNGTIKASTVSKIPYSAFKVINLTP